MKGFFVGAAAGAIAMYLWRDEIGRYLDASTHGFRTRAADTLKQAGDLMESASETIGETLAAGQEAIRPGGPTRVRNASVNR
jgi:gas vesicle protein